MASSLLNAKQEGELNSAIVEYLLSKGFNAAADALMREANCAKPDKSTHLLVKKWTSVVRLQKKVSEKKFSFFFKFILFILFIYSKYRFSIWKNDLPMPVPRPATTVQLTQPHRQPVVVVICCHVHQKHMR